LLAEGIPARGIVAEILAAAGASGVRVERVPRPVLDRLAAGRIHQGVIAEAEPYRYRSWEEAAASAEERGERALLLALDGITDPMNLGSLLRSAEAAGVHAVLVPRRRAAPVTPTRGIWVVALEGEADLAIWECDLLTEPLVLVVGAEGKGISRLISERADARVRIPMAGRVGSLNAAVAGAVALFEVHRKRTSGDG
jgi:23S rRNA (guanosine2251-2'-O)-methyltransferase